MSNQIVNELLDLPSAVLIGSQGLGLSKCDDYDIVITLEDFDSYKARNPRRDYNLVDMQRYFNIAALGNNFLLREYKVDVLIYETLPPVVDIAKVMKQMRKIPKPVLEVKALRVRIFELLLLQHKEFERR